MKDKFREGFGPPREVPTKDWREPVMEEPVSKKEATKGDPKES